MFTLKTKDICEAVSIERHQFRVWTNKLYPYSVMPVKERSARSFTIADLLFFSVVKRMESEFGFNLKSITKISRNLYEFTREPRCFQSSTFIFIDFITGQVTMYNEQSPHGEGVIVDLNKSNDFVAKYLGLIPTSSQKELPFGLQKVE